MGRSNLMHPSKYEKVVRWAQDELIKLNTLGHSNYSDDDFESMREALLNINSYATHLANVLYSGVDNIEID